ncbi:FAD:protein FMN transferase [Solirubrobacter soli]|uniref:FAD:protein FMN transferase n=1 Tax=Solirubrobacter soli TaxID=363832 RepID=UPI000420F5CB|nr:FAD:protein FMN transferase [Solirubrobacter soli]
MTAAHWRAIGTTVGVVVPDRAALAAARRAVIAELAAIDAACSRFRDDSELAAINAAQGRAVAVSPLLQDAVAVALRAAALTGGLVDPTIGDALVLAGYDRDFALVRASRVRRVRAARVAGWRTVALDRDAGTVRVPAGVRLDLGATAKAFAADRAAERALAASGAPGVLVNLGGDLAAAGLAPPAGWAVRVVEPAQDLLLVSGGLATSSTTARRWRRRAGDAHHIIDPRLGAPAVEHWRAVSVAAATCVDANIASTAAIVLGPAAPAWLARAGLPARLVSVSGEEQTTSGWPS